MYTVTLGAFGWEKDEAKTPRDAVNLLISMLQDFTKEDYLHLVYFVKNEDTGEVIEFDLDAEKGGKYYG